MHLKEYTLKITIRKKGRSLYALIPSDIANELKIREEETATILLDYEQRIIAFKFEKDETQM